MTTLPMLIGPTAASAATCGLTPLGDRFVVDGGLDGDGRRVYLTETEEVVRHLPDGRLDYGFGESGFADLAATGPSNDWYARGLVTQHSRTVVLGNDFGPAAAVLIAVSDSGRVDTTFGRSGVLRIAAADRAAIAAVEGPGGSIVVLLGNTNQTTAWGVARVTSSGALDPSFGDAGVAAFSGTEADSPRSLAMRPDGSMVVLAEATSSTDFTTRPALVGLTSSGERHDAFGSGGVVPLTEMTSTIGAQVATASDGSALVLGQAGGTTSYPDYDVVIRVAADGVQDMNFGEQGQARLEGTLASIYNASRAESDLSVDEADRLLVGRADPASSTSVSLTRFTPDGLLDSSFGSGGTARQEAGELEAPVPSVLVEGDGDIAVFSKRALLTFTDGGALATDCTVSGGDVGVARLAGADRYATAAAVSRWGFPTGADTVYIATGLQFPDALAAVPVAARANAPVLLVGRDAVPVAIAAELERLQPARIVVLGGAAAVADELMAQLRAYAPTVQRLAGTGRYETAAALSAATFAPGVPRVYIATGQNFPDALAGGAAAGLLDIPILLTAPGSLPAATAKELARLNPVEVTILGGESAVSDAVRRRIGEALGGKYVERLAGPSRFSTAALIAEQFSNDERQNPGSPAVFLATGANFPDALAAGSAAALNGAPLLLVPQKQLLEVVRNRIVKLSASSILVLGGTSAVGDEILNALRTPGFLRYSFQDIRSDTEPLRWNPCEPIRWVFNPANAPAGALEDAKAAVARVSAASGVPFTYDGTTTETSRLEGSDWGHQPARYGNRPAPVLISFERSAEFGYGQIGLGSIWAPTTQDESVLGSQIISGAVTLNLDFRWSSGFSTGSSVGPVMQHELTHVMGLDHVTYEDELMAPTSDAMTDFGIGDRRGLRQAGTGSPCLPRAVDRL